MADAWGGSWGSSWAAHWGSAVAPVVGTQEITDTDILQLPVNAVLMGQQTIRDRYRENDIRPPDFRTRQMVGATPARRLSGGKPTFTVKSDNRGY